MKHWEAGQVVLSSIKEFQDMKACITEDMKRAMEAGVGVRRSNREKVYESIGHLMDFLQKFRAIHTYTFTAYM